MDADAHFHLPLGEVGIGSPPEGGCTTTGRCRTSGLIVDKASDFGDVARSSPLSAAAPAIFSARTVAERRGGRGEERILDGNVVVQQNRLDLDAFVCCILCSELKFITSPV